MIGIKFEFNFQPIMICLRIVAVALKAQQNSQKNKQLEKSQKLWWVIPGAFYFYGHYQ